MIVLKRVVEVIRGTKERASRRGISRPEAMPVHSLDQRVSSPRGARTSMKSTAIVAFLAAILGGAFVAIPGVSETVRGAVGAMFGRSDPASSPARARLDEPEKSEPKGEASTDETGNVRLTPEQIKLVGLKTAVAKQTPIVLDLRLNGEITANQDRTVQILPRTPGIVREVLKNLGDRVRANESIAIIESRELSEAEAAYLAAQSKSELAQRQLEREKSLYDKKITAEQEYLAAKQAAETAMIELRAAEQKLILLGLDPKAAKAKPAGTLAPVRVPVFAPFGGTLIEKRIAVGDQVNDQTPLFRLANLDQVWVIASVFEKDLGHVSIGQPATVVLRAYPDRKFEGRITWISEVLDEKTRTLKIRVELDNRERLLKPGSFAHVYLKTVIREDGVAVPPAAVQRQKAEFIVFVDVGNGVYKRREVKIGARSATAIEVIEGLKPGEAVVTDGSFALKSELEKSAFADND